LAEILARTAGRDRHGVLREAAGGVRIAVRLSPGAVRERVVGLVDAEDGRRALKVAVRAPPEGGRANEALIDLLARQWDLSRKRLQIVSGHASRRKSVFIAGDPAELGPRLARWLDRHA